MCGNQKSAGASGSRARRSGPPRSISQNQSANTTTLVSQITTADRISWWPPALSPPLQEVVDEQLERHEVRGRHEREQGDRDGPLAPFIAALLARTVQPQAAYQQQLERRHQPD